MNDVTREEPPSSLGEMAARFLLLLLASMAGSALFGALALGIMAALREGAPQLALTVPLMAAMGAGLVLPVALALGLPPSALVFAAIFALGRRFLPPRHAAALAGGIMGLGWGLVGLWAWPEVLPSWIVGWILTPVLAWRLWR